MPLAAHAVPLAHFVQQFVGAVYRHPEMVAYRPGWLWAAKCKAWMVDDPAQIVTILAVYRSVLVTDLKPMYRPVTNLVCNAEAIDVLAQGVRDDETRFMHGRGEFKVMRLRPADYTPSPMCPPLEEMKRVAQAEAERLVRL
ncbi:hypothetical protein BJD46_gp67 [Mycobacterium phage Bactobuster]|uniref:Uncharacterized protein n=2 Tax=Pukovnikvirus TaxID=2948873 RepID=A0A127KQ24_9CAUD|nr:hypothetical protein BJD46_gp67 [Mycobacterium phage Bactobuster]YP_010064344.1 hypothetical protein KI248_gp29 [Mycobacterium phage Phaded]AMO44035.1 hypothetical protein SEA_BACTOBUSTER_67 [Mycobacterium phage Bactobuster]QGZ16870.1 hypothetical protein SEA_PHADED_70 [Mycobacterium phage Phaded]